MSESKPVTSENPYGLPDSCRLREASDEDLAAITAIYNQAVSSGGASADITVQSLKEREEWLHAHAPRTRYPVVVVQQADEVVAFASLSRFHPRAGYDADVELSYYVETGHRGAGLGTALLRWGLQSAHDGGYAMLITVIFADNLASMALMSRFDFTRYGLLPRAAVDAVGACHDVAYWYRRVS